MQDWEYQWQHLIAPVLDTYFSPPSSSDAPSVHEPGTITLWDSAQVYTAVYNILTSNSHCPISKDELGTPKEIAHPGAGAHFLQESLDRYLSVICQQSLSRLQAPHDEDPTPFLPRYFDAFTAYKASITSSQLRTAFSALERYHNTHIRTANYGWFARAEYSGLSPEDRETLQIRELQATYGLPSGDWTERDRRKAEKRAEVRSALSTPVGLEAMGLRRWRLDVAEPLLKTASGLGTIKRLESAGNSESLIRQLGEALGEVGMEEVLGVDC
ncbi:hypothetical protein OE88DRAFT_1738243 [Heliocybe sulcata]|uniref:Uncharacterized protein n=1 Tax=Heliocybe sulcata TaxID=5364 RepID=A0A5C3MTD3_9AGAM|nr:hypothetical protein OE88DRAFT_1738243 [Heliocybe sulcata]